MLYPGGDPKLTLSLASGLGLGLTFEKTISIKNLKANAKDEYRQRLLGENLQNLWGWKGLGLGLGLTPRVRVSFFLTLALGLGLGLTPGKTISVENLKPNAKDEYRRRRLG